MNVTVLITGIQVSTWDRTHTDIFQGTVSAFHVADTTFITEKP